MNRILIIDNDPTLAETLRHNLELDGHEVEVEQEGAYGLAQAREFQPDLVIANLLILESDEYILLQQLRAEHPSLPVLILASRTEEAARLPGFRLGTDDFILRPASVLEVHGRIDALLRRTDTNGTHHPEPVVETVIRFGTIEVHPATRAVLRGGEPVSLRPKEFDLLVALLNRHGRIVSRLELLREVWGYRSSIVSRTVDSHVAELRRKLERNPAEPDHILTVRKAGYRLQR